MRYWHFLSSYRTCLNNIKLMHDSTFAIGYVNTSIVSFWTHHNPALPISLPIPLWAHRISLPVWIPFRCLSPICLRCGALSHAIGSRDAHWAASKSRWERIQTSMPRSRFEPPLPWNSYRRVAAYSSWPVSYLLWRSSLCVEKDESSSFVAVNISVNANISVVK